MTSVYAVKIVKTADPRCSIYVRFRALHRHAPSRRQSVRVLPPLPDARPIDVEEEGDGHHQQAQTPNERRGPVDAQVVEHRRYHQREGGGEDGAEECVGLGVLVCGFECAKGGGVRQRLMRRRR